MLICEEPDVSGRLVGVKQLASTPGSLGVPGLDAFLGIAPGLEVSLGRMGSLETLLGGGGEVHSEERPLEDLPRGQCWKE